MCIFKLVVLALFFVTTFDSFSNRFIFNTEEIQI